MKTKKVSEPFYITTTLPYVNAEPHVGFAMEVIRADAIARFKAELGSEVFFNTGTDEHGSKILEKASSAGVSPKEFVDEKVKKFQELTKTLGLLSSINFVRTTDGKHVQSAQEFWKVCDKNGYIYKKNYRIKYCIGCELEKTDSELENGKCSIHPTYEIEIREEENYFFKFSAFQKQLLYLYESRPDFVVPSTRLGEIKSFVEKGLEDFSISRLKSKMAWGIEVPGDSEHVMYVWFDALVNYISVVGWPSDKEKFKKWWEDTGGVVQYCGKDNLRQQSAMWQAMLMAAGLPPSKQIVIDGFITGEGGVKMSKSLGNTIDPTEVVKEYGTDALRYFVLRELHPFEDSPFSMERFKETYNANLANGLGNLLSRVVKMAASNGVSVPSDAGEDLPKEYTEAFSGFNLKEACDFVWQLIQATDKRIQEKAPFKLVKTDLEAGQKEIHELLVELRLIIRLLKPILPETASLATKAINDMQVSSPLFPRKE